MFCKVVGTFATVVALATVLVGARTQGAGQDPQAQALLAKHHTYVGWQFGDGTFRNMRVTGSVTGEKGERTVTFVLLSSGLVYRNTYTYLRHGSVTEQEGFTGNVFWQSDLNGFTTPIYGDYARFLALPSISTSTRRPAHTSRPRSIQTARTRRPTAFSRTATWSLARR